MRKFKMENMTFEQLLAELNNVVELLESGKLSLEESVEVYQKGMALSIECKKRLDAAKEVIVKKVTSEGETNVK
ncbi:MAG: exodeoxyribonuclease VII small subunit [Erysipelotrichaceae bacterium]|nr:exodeoxyribonuclease VII small subunit [Erysipelotrichaceae bacterium]